MDSSAKGSPQLLLLVSSLATRLSVSTVILGTIGSCVLYLLGLVIYRLTLHPLAKYPGPLFARVSDWYGVYHAWLGDRHLNQYRVHQKYGPMVRLAPDLLSINHIDALRDIYGVNKNIQKSRQYYSRHLDNDEKNASIISVVSRQAHSVHRRMLAHAFTDNALRDFEPIIQEKINDFINMLGSKDGFIGNMADCCTWLTYDIMGELVFGKEFGMMRGNERHMPELISTATHASLITGARPQTRRFGFDKLIFPTIVGKDMQMMAYSRKQILERLELGSERRDVTHYILQGRKIEGGETDVNLKPLFADSRSLIIAGTDTTAVQLAASFYYITRNPHVLERLTAEIRSTFSSVDEITPQSVTPCAYLKAVVDETLRMSPSVPGGVYREALPGGATVLGDHLPEKTEVIVPIYTIHHNADYYPEPFKYMPERWLEDESNKDSLARARAAFNPFSLGARGCIGKRLAYIELYVTMAKTVFLYDMRYVQGGKDPRTADGDVYRMEDHFTAEVHGPDVQFFKRKDLQ